MEYLKYILKFFFRIRWWLIVLPLLAAIIAWFASKKLPLIYDVKTTIYTGIISGYNIESGTAPLVDAKSNMANLLNIISAEKTLKQVSMRLLAECVIHGSPEKDNNYIEAVHYREIMGMMPNEVKNLIDKNSVDRTVENFLAYERPSKDNFIYALLNYSNPYFSIRELTDKIIVKQLGASDMIDISYSCNDPGIAFNTLEILNKEFIKQYQEIRFGETDNVIAYFRSELARVGKDLQHAEDSLITYNIDKRIINYGEQTKQVTIMDADHQMKLQQLLLDYSSTKALADFLEKKLGNQARTMLANSAFIKQLNKISQLNNKIAMGNINPSEQTKEEASKINQYKDELKDAEKSFSGLADIIGHNQAGTSTDNIAQSELVDQWLTQVMLAEKTKAELNAMDSQRQKLDGDFLYYSPIGATINRQERNIGFVESTYMSLLNSLNSALLRQKNLQMTSATLRVMNPPTFPLKALPTKRAMLVLATFILTFVFITGYFILIEILDRTLRDKFRAERITGGKVMGVYPGESPHKYRRYNRLINEIGMKFISKSILPYFKKGQLNIVNLISTESKDGKTFLAGELEEYWSSMGFKVKRLTYNQDFNAEDKKYIMAQSIRELAGDVDDYDIILTEYPELKESSISPALLKEATVNLLVIRANRTWKGTDQSSFVKLKKIIGDDSVLFIYLNMTSREATQEVLGQLPPYSRFENTIYRLSQFGLTAKDNTPS